MYAEYWGLTRQPFENMNDPAFLYSSRRHREGLARMHYAVQQKKLGILVVGEYGTGKTFLSRTLRNYLSQDQYKFVYLTNPQLSPIELMNPIALELKEDSKLHTRWSKPDYLRYIKQILEEYHEQGIHVVIFFDEVQSIPDESLLEEIRLLFNFQGDDYPLFTFILMGQPAIEEMVAKLPQLKQRLSIRFELTPLNEEETEAYIDHRLRIAGTDRKIFTRAAYSEVYKLSHGMPRAINNVCDLALLTGFVERAEYISESIITKISEDMGDWLSRND